MNALPSHARVCELIDYNPKTGDMTWKIRRFGVTVGSKVGTNHKGYLRVKVDGKLILAHRLAWFMANGRWPEFEIDHINMIRSDNRIENLREASRSENMINRNYPVGKSGRTGVSVHRYGWQAAIRVNKKTKFLGLFKSLDEAISARVKAESIYGNFLPIGE